MGRIRTFRVSRSIFSCFVVFLAASFLASCAHVPTADLTVPKVEGLKRGYADVNGFKMHYVVKGQGDPLILIHGYGGNIFCWRHNIDMLADHFTVYAVDLRGFGLSDKPEDSDWTFDEFAKDLDAFMDVMGIEKAHLVGNSLGGGVAWGVASFYPDRVKSLVLVDALAYPFDFIFEFKALKNPIIGPVALKMFSRPSVWLMLKKSVYYDASKVTKETVDGYTAPLKDPKSRWAMRKIIRTNEPEDYADYNKHLAGVKVPTLIIWGEQDEILPLSHGYRLQKDIVNSDFMLIPECGHCPNEEKPEVVNDAILRFINTQFLANETDIKKAA